MASKRTFKNRRAEKIHHRADQRNRESSRVPERFRGSKFRFDKLRFQSLELRPTATSTVLRDSGQQGRQSKKHNG
jgi:hypothetical protein